MPAFTNLCIYMNTNNIIDEEDIINPDVDRQIKTIINEYIEHHNSLINILRFTFINRKYSDDFSSYSIRLLRPIRRSDLHIYQLKLIVIRNRIGRIIDYLTKQNNKQRVENKMVENEMELIDQIQF